MSMVIASVIFVILLAVAIASFVWSLGGTWPIRNEQLLARAVVGRPGLTRMPRLAAFGVAAASLAVGVVALALADPEAGGVPLSLLGVLCGALLIARGMLGFTAGWRARYPEEPFATLDRSNYSPLALIVGAGFLLLVGLRLIP